VTDRLISGGTAFERRRCNALFDLSPGIFSMDTNDLLLFNAPRSCTRNGGLQLVKTKSSSGLGLDSMICRVH
jgi:hypothetical protein